MNPPDQNELSAWERMNHEDLLVDAQGQHQDKLAAERKSERLEQKCRRLEARLRTVSVQFALSQAECHSAAQTILRLEAQVAALTRQNSSWELTGARVLRHSQMAKDAVVENLLRNKKIALVPRE